MTSGKKTNKDIESGKLREREREGQEREHASDLTPIFPQHVYLTVL